MAMVMETAAATMVAEVAMELELGTVMGVTAGVETAIMAMAILRPTESLPALKTIQLTRRIPKAQRNPTLPWNYGTPTE